MLLSLKSNKNILVGESISKTTRTIMKINLKNTGNKNLARGPS